MSNNRNRCWSCGSSALTPEALTDLRPDLVLVMNPIYVPEITAMLHGLGLHPDIRALRARAMARAGQAG